MEVQSLEFEIDYDLEVEMELADDATMDQMDADPLVGKGPYGPIPESGPSSGPTRSRHSRIPRVPPRASTAIASAVINVLDDDHEVEFKSESETDDDVKGEDVHAISTSSSSMIDC